MGQEISSSHFSARDFTTFAARLREETALLGRWFDQDRLENHTGVGGFELEAWLVDKALQPAPVNEALIERLGGDVVVPELAQFNLELNGVPQRLQGGALNAMRDDLEYLQPPSRLLGCGAGDDRDVANGRRSGVRP